jgi:MauM/NapG family ferredoxin protein
MAEQKNKGFLTLTNIRRIYSVFFITLFIVLLAITDFRNMKGYEVGLFLELDPLASILSFLTSWTVYKGLELSLIIIITTLFFGRYFCSWVCPLGILNHWVGHFFNKRGPTEDFSVNEYRKSYRLKYYILSVLAVLALFGSLQIGLLDPVALVTRSFVISVLPAVNYWAPALYLTKPLFYGGLFITLLFVAILFANRFQTRFFCRVLCPLGALLGVLSTRALLRIRRDVGKCNDCRDCLRYCQGGCDPHGSLRISECHVCLNCLEQCPEGAIHYGLPKTESSVHVPIDVNRRRLIETAVAGLILFPMMRSVVNARSAPHHEVIRPPGTLPEEDFLRRCIKCGECMRVCPTNVIQPTLLEAGLEGIWTPILIMKIGYCEYNCVLCGQVCPTGAIVPITVEKKVGESPYNKPVKIGTAFFDRGRCLPWAMDIECIVCEEVCPTSPKAIWFESVKIRPREGGPKVLKLPHLDPKLCVGCGICENKCPVHDRAAVRVTSIEETRSPTNKLILED